MLNLRDMKEQQEYLSAMEKIEYGKKVNLSLANELQKPFSTIETSAELIIQGYKRIPEQCLLTE